LGGLFYSSNGGLDWTQRSAGLPSPPPSVYAIALSLASEKYIATGSGIFKRTTSEWFRVSELVATEIVTDPADASTLYAGGVAGMYKTTDGGESWDPINDGLLDRPVNVIAIDPLMPSTVYIGAANEVYRSTDGGTSWSPILSVGLRVPRLARPRPPTRSLPPRPTQ